MGVNRIIRATLVAGCLISSFSCTRIIDFVKGGAEVNFYGSTRGSETDTKASYKGGDYSVGQIEPIYWSVGDVLSIYCDQADISEANTAKVADYVISKVYSDQSQADIVLNSATTPCGLRWNNNETLPHDFYAVFPSPGTAGITTSINLKTIKGNLTSDSQNTLSGALTGSESAGYVLAPDFKWMMMEGCKTGLTRATFPAKGTVFVQFQPLTTAIRFTITNSVAKDLVIKELDLISAGTQIAGKFKVADMTVNAADGYPAVVTDETTPANFKTVKIALNPAVTIKQNKTFTFTFFLAPIHEVSDLKFRIVRGGADDGATLTTRLGYNDGTGIVIPRCKKTIITGIMVPEGVQWTIDYEPELCEWENGGSTDITLK